MNWTAIGILLTLILFCIKMVWDLYEYYRKRRDNLTDTDHEQVHAIKASLREVSIEVGMLNDTLKQIASNTTKIDGRLGKSEQRIAKLEYELSTQESILSELTKRASENSALIMAQQAQVRDLQEALRIAAIHHKKNHGEDLGIDRLLH